MRKGRRKRCRFCKQWFRPDPRTFHHQRYCSRAPCRKASKTASQVRWHSKPSNQDIDAYLGLEYDVIGIEEATTLTSRKYQDIATCCRTSKPNWRPRIYSTTNPGGVGHAWYRTKFVLPYSERRETDTRFVPARVTDNRWNNPEYLRVLENLTGWQKRAWLDGDWDIAAGQFFTGFRRDVHVLDDFDDTRAVEWFAALDYGFAHYTVCLLGCRDGDGNIYVVDEHAERMWLPQRHAAAIKAMVGRHRVAVDSGLLRVDRGGKPETGAVNT